MKVGEKFKPHPKLKKVYYVYLSIVAVPLLVIALVPTLAAFVYVPKAAPWLVAFLLAPIVVILSFLAYWVSKYYRSISFTLEREEVLVERGVWWKMKHVVPYSRVMSVDAIQGPISRHFDVGRVDIHTAGYTGPSGGSAGPGMRRAEAAIWGVPNFLEIRDSILNFVRERPLFGAPGARARDVGSEILSELRRIRKVLQKG